MGQADVIKFLEIENRWMTSKEVQNKLKVLSVRTSLLKLWKLKEIDRKQIFIGYHKVYVYKIK